MSEFSFHVLNENVSLSSPNLLPAEKIRPCPLYSVAISTEGKNMLTLIGQCKPLDPEHLRLGRFKFSPQKSQIIFDSLQRYHFKIL